MQKITANKFLLRRVIAIIFLIILFFIIKNYICCSLYKREFSKIRVLLNNEIISLKDNIYIEDNVIYFSEDDVKNIFDNNIYYNVGDCELITTFNKHVAVMHLDSKDILINDSNINIEGSLRKFDSEIYIPLSELQIVYDIEVSYQENTNLVIIDSLSKAKSQAMAIKNVGLKKTKNMFSYKIENIKKGDNLYIIEDNGKYKKVRTECGNIGYIKSRKLSEPQNIRDNLNEENLKINFLEECSDINKNYENIILDSEKENAIIVDLFQLNKDNTIAGKIDIQSQPFQNYYNWTEQNGISIIADFTIDTNISATMTTYAQRNRIINDIYNKVLQSKCKGVCVDFTEIDDINSFNRFLIELTPKFKESGLKVVVKNNKYIMKKKIEKIVDGII